MFRTLGPPQSGLRSFIIAVVLPYMKDVSPAETVAKKKRPEIHLKQKRASPAYVMQDVL